MKGERKSNVKMKKKKRLGKLLRKKRVKNKKRKTRRKTIKNNHQLKKHEL